MNECCTQWCTRHIHAADSLSLVCPTTSVCDLETRESYRRFPKHLRGLFRALNSELLRGAFSSEVDFGGASAGNVHSDLLLHDALHASALHGQLLIGDGG